MTSSSPQPAQQPEGVFGKIRHLTRQLRGTSLDGEGGELQAEARKIEELAAYMERREEIAAASETLEAHGAAFEEVMADPATAMERAYDLFSEERFVSLRYSAEDLERAFEAVGYPSHAGEISDDDMDIALAAAAHLVGDEEERFHLARRLLLALPEYVAAGRYRDAWLIQHSAYRLLETPEESCPFMFVMFQLAYEEWLDRIEEKRAALLEELGVERSAIGQMSVEEVYAFTTELLEDPDKKARIEAFYAAHPAMRDQTATWLFQLEDEAIELLEREDAECILLSPEEVWPWMPGLVNRAGPVIERMREVITEGREPDPEVQEKVGDALVATIQEMVAEVYTPERVDQLVANLKDYRQRLIEAGDKEAAQRVNGALLALQREEPPAENRFLLAACYASVRAVMAAAAEEAAAARDLSRTNHA